jgi:hypothetical protein
MVLVKALSVNGTTTNIPIVSGTVTADRTSQDFRRTCEIVVNSLFVEQPDGTNASMIPMKDYDPLNIYGNHLYIYRGIVWNIDEVEATGVYSAHAPLADDFLRPANGAYELVPVGVFRINSLKITEDKDGDVSITVDGTDVSNNIAKNHWTEPVTIWKAGVQPPIVAPSTSDVGNSAADAYYPIQQTYTLPNNYGGLTLASAGIQEAIKLLIYDRWPNNPALWPLTDDSFDFSGIQDVPLKVPVIMGSHTVSNSGSNSPWTDISGLAAAVGGGIGELYVDVEGKFKMVAIADPNAVEPVWDFFDGNGDGAGGLLTNVSRTISDSKAVNFVIATGESITLNQPYKAVASDTDPTSPTYVNGPFGRVVAYEPGHKLLTTLQQTQVAARTFLSWFTGGDDQMVMKGVPNPLLDVNDVVRVRRKRLGVYNAYEVVAVIDTFLKHTQSYTQITVLPLVNDIPAGTTLIIKTGIGTQEITTTQTATSTNTVLNVAPFTPTNDYVIGVSILDPKITSNDGAVNYYIDKIVIPLDFTTEIEITMRERRVGTRKDAVRIAEYSQDDPNAGL